MQLLCKLMQQLQIVILVFKWAYLFFELFRTKYYFNNILKLLIIILTSTYEFSINPVHRFTELKGNLLSS
jgi:hypothetical protein